MSLHELELFIINNPGKSKAWIVKQTGSNHTRVKRRLDKLMPAGKRI